MLNDQTIALLESRGISGETAARLGWNSSSKPGFDLEIPYRRGDQVVNRKYRTLKGDKRFAQDKGGEQRLYNADVMTELGDFPLIITEGEMDCAIATQCGYMAVSVPGGAPSSEIEDEHAKKYAWLAEVPDHCVVIICSDDDAPGKALLHDLSLRLGRERCKWVKYPRECKDLNEAFVKYHQAGVDETIKRAKFVAVDGIYRMSEIPPLPNLEAVPCPISGMDECLKFRPGDFTVVTGVPSHGKSTFVNEVAAYLARREGWNIAFASFEQSPRGDHHRNLRTLFHSKPPFEQSTAEIRQADDWIDEKFTFIVPSIDDDVTLKWCLDRCRAAIVQHGCKLVVIDPWNEMDHDCPDGMSLTQYTGFAIKQFKKLARKYLVHVLVVAHPAKLQRKQDGSYPMPSLYDISDSSHWYNKADLGVIVHKPDNDSTVVRVAKVRYFGEIGKPCDVTLKFDNRSKRYSLAA